MSRSHRTARRNFGGLGSAIAVGTVLAALGWAGPAAGAAPGAPVVIRDGADALPGAPDLRRVAVSQAADGRVRVALSLARAFGPRDLLAPARAGGPPGSLCVRLWTTTAPGAQADFLACVTARGDGRTFRATVSREVAGALPAVVGSAAVSRPSGQSVALRIARTVLGRPARIRFAAEATRPGCTRLRCVDLAPDAGATATFRLR